MQVLPQVSLIQCMCCCEEKPRSSVTVCRKNHALCAACAERLGRVDCLFCNPYSPQKPEGPAISWTEKVKIENPHSKSTLYQELDTGGIMVYIMKFPKGIENGV